VTRVTPPEKFLFGEALAVVSARCREEHVSRARRRVAAVPLHYLAQKRTFFAQIVKNVNLSARTFTEH